MILNIGLDVHGVIDRYPELFSTLTKLWQREGHVIHIITGQEWENVEPQVAKYDITYHNHYSIVDFHKSIGTRMWVRSDKEGWWMDRNSWNCSKGNYATYHGLNLHFDDTSIYANSFPEWCTFIHVPKEGFVDIIQHIFNLDIDI